MAADQAKILIVDDDRELRELIAETLSEYGYDSRRRTARNSLPRSSGRLST